MIERYKSILLENSSVDWVEQRLYNIDYGSDFLIKADAKEVTIVHKNDNNYSIKIAVVLDEDNLVNELKLSISEPESLDGSVSILLTVIFYVFTFIAILLIWAEDFYFFVKIIATLIAVVVGILLYFFSKVGAIFFPILANQHKAKTDRIISVIEREIAVRPY